MAYWIHENGETIGPLRREQVLQQAGPGTPVSDGGEWINLGQHPDFATLPDQPFEPPSIPPTESEKQPVPEERATAPIEVVQPAVDPQKTPNPEDSDFRRVRRLAKATKPPAPDEPKKKTKGRLGGWAIFAAVLAITGFLAFYLLTKHEGFRRSSDVQVANQWDIETTENDIGASPDFQEAASQADVDDPPTAVSPQTIDQEIAAAMKQLHATSEALKSIEAEYERLSYRYPTFNVSGEIRGRGESSVRVWGVALPSTGDITHLGALVKKGDILVNGVTRLKNPSFYTREGLFFVDKMTGEITSDEAVPMRVYSTQPPPARAATEQEFDRLRNEMKPYHLEIERLKGEIRRLRQEEYEHEWHAVADSVPGLVVYAKERFATDDKEGSARACARIEELAPPEADPYVECGLLAEQSGDFDLALARYGEALGRDSSHAMANRREALLLSRQQEDLFEEARLLLRYEEFDDPTATDAQAVHDRLTTLKEEWGRESRRACLAFDEARIDQVQWDTMNKGPTNHESIARNITACERSKAEARAQLQTLSANLVSINLNVQALMMDSHDDHEYWQSRSQQASALRQQIDSTESSLNSEHHEEKIPIHRERIRRYQEILHEIEQEAKKIGVAL